MHFRLILVAAGLLGFVAPAQSQASSLDRLNGVWTTTDNPQKIQFNKNGGKITVTFPFLPGLSTIVDSNGKWGSDIRVSGTSFECFYSLTPINPHEFTWTLKRGDEVCPKSNHFLKDPPW
jgi:hypothetical protein